MSSANTARSAKVRGRRSVRPSIVVIYVVLSVLAILFLTPYYVVVRNAISSRADITGLIWKWIPDGFQLGSLLEILAINSPILRGMVNSLVIATAQTLGQLIIAAMAGYALARMNVWYRNIIFAIFLATMMVPSAVTFIPTFAVVAKLGWVNTLTGIIVPGLFNIFTMFIYRQFFLDFPSELEEAGKIDGLGSVGVFLRIVVPNSWGVTVALGSIAFINSWNAFLWPLVIGQDESTWTVQVAVSSFLNSYSIDLPGLFAGSLVSILPLVIGFFVFQRYIVQGVKFSGVKG